MDEELKLRRSILGLELDRTDLIDQDPLGVPTPDRVIPEIACDAVRVLREIGHAEYAVEYAYQVIRANFNNPDGHRAFLIALSPFGPEPLLETQWRRPANKRRLGKWSGLGKRRQGKPGSAVGRNAGGQSGTMAPAASLVLLRGRERMGQTDWEEA